MNRFPFGYSFCFRWWDAEAIANDGLKGDFVGVSGCTIYPFTTEEILQMARNTKQNPQNLLLENLKKRVEIEAEPYKNLEDFSMEWHFEGNGRLFDDLPLYL